MAQRKLTAWMGDSTMLEINAKVKTPIQVGFLLGRSKRRIGINANEATARDEQAEDNQ